MERIIYSGSWMGRETGAGISLERISPHISSQLADNWAASAAPEGSTPGKQNSIYIAKEASASTLNVNPNPFSPDNDGYEDITILQYQLSEQTALMTVDIFDIIGRRVRRLADQMPVGQNGSIIWDGKDNEGRVCRIGIYIFFVRVFQTNKNLFKEMKETVVLVKK